MRKTFSNAIIIWPFLLLFFVLPTNIIAQPCSLPTPTKAQMYEDFDEYVKILEQCNPQLYPRFMATGINLLDSIKAERPMIENVETLKEFVSFMRKSLSKNLDIHAKWIREPSRFPHYCGDFDTAYIVPIRKMYENQNGDIGLDLVYLKNRYYLAGGIRLVKANGNQQIFNNNEVYEINGIRVDQKINTWSAPRFDFKQNHAYDAHYRLNCSSGYVWGLIDKNGEKISLFIDSFPRIGVSFCSYDSIRNLESKKRKHDQQDLHITYLKSIKTLYIATKWLPFDHIKDWAKRVRNFGKNKKIDHVIIDMRDNNGGSELVWHEMLANLVDTLKIPDYLAFPNTKSIREILKNDSPDLKTIPFSVPCLPGQEFLLDPDTLLIINPSPRSLKIKGKIFVLQNQFTYSAAHSLTSSAQYLNQLISVGTPSGLLAGRGTDPYAFQLKNSKFSFKLECAIDLTRINTPHDIYHECPEVIVDLTIEDIIRLRDDKLYCEPIYSPQYLLNKDSFIKKVLELIACEKI